MTALMLGGAYAALFAAGLGVGGRQGGLAGELVALALLMSYPLAVLVGLAHAFARAREGARGAAAGVPLLLLLAGVPAVLGVGNVDDTLRDVRFTRHLAEVEALLEAAALGIGERIHLPSDALPEEIRACCARAVFVRRDAEGRLSATLVGTRRTAYLYDPTGVRLAQGIDTGRWRSHRQVAPAWYRVERF